ncbi:GNAT family N-acetyltransferase [Yinghuangia seranimata]|uniref:GNAT family N-acetyltransferase n=1 Tax=Yinghuangia seranimata TaxID=408067 RepID=UPI00248CC185|nr:GNAT family N-acetyltransferase [Yinghuangia seranimata]MDI2132489.1 GNAT family N-acetyltransferase [Yinghuangia seranimata]
MTDVSVRTARSEDGPALGVVQASAWRAAYQGVLPEVALEPFDPEVLAAGWGHAAAHPPSSRHTVLVACAEAKPVGFAAVVPAQDPDLDEDALELTILVVAPAEQRKGHASRLLAAAVEHARGQGAGVLVMWVLEPDAPLREFLETAGWAVDGARRDLELDEHGAQRVRQWRLHTDVEEDATEA